MSPPRILEAFVTLELLPLTDEELSLKLRHTFACNWVLALTTERGVFWGRLVTQLYDEALRPAEIRATQFPVLARLRGPYCGQRSRRPNGDRQNDPDPEPQTTGPRRPGRKPPRRRPARARGLRHSQGAARPRPRLLAVEAGSGAARAGL